MLLPPAVALASRLQRGPSLANAGFEPIDRPRRPQRAPMDHLLPRAPKPNGDAGCCTERGTLPGTLGRAVDSHIISSRLPPSSESDETVPAAPIAAVCGTEFVRGCMAHGRIPRTAEQ